MLNLSTECWGLVALTSLLGVGCSYTATVSAQRTFTFPLHLYFQWYQHTELHQHRLWTSSGSVSRALMEREDFLLTAAAQEPCPGWCRKGTHSRMGGTGYGHSTAGHCWEGTEFFKAHFAHRPRATCSCSTASFQTQLVFEEIPWESLTDKINQHWEGTVVDGNLKWQSFTLF